MDLTITLLGDGALFGFTYFAKGDRIEGFEDEDWAELNIYLVIVRFSWKFW